MNLTISKHIRAGYVAAFVLLLFSFMLVFYTNSQMQRQTELVIHTNYVISQIDIVLSDVKDGETGLRGYLVTKDRDFLMPYYNSKLNLPKSLHILEGLISNSDTQKLRFDSLKLLLLKRFAIIDTVKQVFDLNNLVIADFIIPTMVKGRLVMDDIRNLCKKMQNAELIVLTSRTAEVNSFRKAINVINIAALVIALLLAIFSLISYSRENREKNSYRINLEKKVQDLNVANIELVKLKSNEKFAATGRIARTIAHEVRNPLTNIILAAEQLKETSLKDEETMLYFDMIKRNGERINQLVSELLNATKHIVLKPDKLSINNILDEAFELAKDRVKLQHLTVEKKYSTDICDVLVDKEQIKIAFLNLIVNAIEAIEKNDGKLLLETKGENGKCVIVIKDNGTGIDKDNLSKLFEPYFTNKEKGNGLGLTNTQNIILNHKGHIHVESEPGIGTAFTVTLDFAT